MNRSTVASLAILLAAASQSIAQLGPVKPPAPASPKSSTPPRVEPSTPAASPAAAEPSLGGPKVTAAETASTLIERDLEGKVKRLVVSPAEAAVKLLKLDAPTRAKVDAVLIDNAAAWDGFVRTNLKDVLRIAQGLQSLQSDAKQGQPDAPMATPHSGSIAVPGKDRQPAASPRGSSGAAQLLEELRGLMNATPAQPADAAADAAPAQSLRARGTIGNQLAAVLSAEEAAAMQALVKQYVDARIADRITEAKAAGQELRPAQATSREMLEALGGEFKRAYERTVGQAAKKLDDTIKMLQLSPEQESKFRQISGDSFQKTYGTASAQERSRVFFEIYQILTPQQREILVKQIR